MRAPITRFAFWYSWLESSGSVRRIEAQATPTWSVNATPITAIGVVDGPADQELAGVSGARRLRDGRVVIANGKPLELRIYDAHGTMLRRIGRTGHGPGEFSGRLDLLPAGGDSLLVYDKETQRLSLFGTDGKLWHEWPASDEGSPRGQQMSLPSIVRRRCAGQSHRLPAPVADRHAGSAAASASRGRVDRRRPFSGSRQRCRVVDRIHGSWRRRRSAPYSARFEVYEATRDLLVGKALLEDDVEQVQVLKVNAPPAAGQASTHAWAESIPSRRRRSRNASTSSSAR